MPASQGAVGLGTTIAYSAALSPPTFTNYILEPKDITGPGSTLEKAEFTHMQSTSGYREYKPTFKTSGDVTFKTNYVHDDASHMALIAANQALPPTLMAFLMTGLDGSTFQFEAYVGLSWSYPMGGPIEMNVTLQIEGPVTAA